MSRLPRFVLPGQPQHVIQRGNNRQTIFADAEDYAIYLQWLGEACRRFDCDLHAYVLMTNHVHLLMTPHSEDAIAKVMQSLGRRYVGYFNARHGRSGTLWEGRYRATLVDSAAYLLACMRYIELNPVRAGMVSHPSRYFYSSYAGNTRAADDPLLRPHRLYHALGKTPAERRRAYRALVQRRLDEETLQEIRTATNKAWVLGGKRFTAKVERLTGRRATPKPRGGDRKSKAFREAVRIKGPH
jgi:putative transposase